MKLLSTFVILCAVGFSSTTFAQSHNDKGSQIKVDGEIEFDVGDTKIRIGGNNYDGRDTRSLNERIYRLEKAVRYLMERQGFHPQEKCTEYECTLETPFDGMFIARSDSEASARALVVQKCNQATGNGMWCKSDKAKCSEVK